MSEASKPTISPRSDEELFAQVLELGRLMGWHDGSGRSQHQEYVNAYSRRRRRSSVLEEDALLVRHAEVLNCALVEATLRGGELAELVVEQQRDDKPWIRRPRHILGLEEPAALAALNRSYGRAVWVT